MKIEQRRSGEVLILRVSETRLDAMVALEFKEAVMPLAGAGPARVVLDLGCVSFLDSSGLGALVGLKKYLAPERDLELAALQPQLSRVLALTRLDSVFVIHPQPPMPPSPGVPPLAAAS